MDAKQGDTTHAIEVTMMDHFGERTPVTFQSAYQPGGAWRLGTVEDFVEASGIPSQLQPGTAETGDFVQLPEPVATMSSPCFEPEPPGLADHIGRPVTALWLVGHGWVYHVWPLDWGDGDD